MLINGQWRVLVQSSQYAAIMPEGFFRCSGTDQNQFNGTPGRYRLYISRACPWSHQAVLMWCLKGLAPLIDMRIVHPVITDAGWSFQSGRGVVADETVTHIRDLYIQSEPEYTGSVTVPVLWDKAQQVIVTHDATDILQLLDRQFESDTPTYYPIEKLEVMHSVSQFIQNYLYEGVHKAGLAETQLEYETQVTYVFDALGELDELLSKTMFITGSEPTACDCQLWPILIRFDAVYYSLFKCNQKHVWDYPNINRYIQSVYNLPGVAKTVNMDHIHAHYYASDWYKNTATILPIGPILPWLDSQTNSNSDPE
ncbi:MAG: glutathione S-transferase C-terminal domain-containing protein [Candidatus Marinamargulisbacteria bacterium]|nr:glutathione-dependent reductase [bacterium]MDG2264494.1 glutathione S-transferase C-terminal domain-containing protein [Candidatus Marinamargulisbacteria bacterium]|tara:strand:+ start:2062 stop:2994 length:933 start_codon:yes stop_codon:yes gene_type:complete